MQTVATLRTSLNFNAKGATRKNARYTRRLDRLARARGFANYAQFEMRLRALRPALFA